MEHFEDYLRSRQFATAYGDPLFHDTLTIYQDGETCYIAACLNFVLHVPELRSMFFKAFRLKAVALDQLTESHFSLLGGFVGEPLGAQILSLAQDISGWSHLNDDRLRGMTRSLMLAMTPRIDGFKAILRRCSRREASGPIRPVHVPAPHDTKAFDQTPGLRGGFVSASRRG